MAKLNKLGNIIAHCPGCEGSKSSFEFCVNGKNIGIVIKVS